MRSWLIVLIAVVASGIALGANEELPKADPSDELEIDPPLLIKDGKPLVPLPSPDAPAGDPQQLEIAIEKAKRAASAGERQFKAGIIAKVQVEERALKIVRLERDLANARFELAKQEHADRQKRFDAGEIARADLDESANAERAAADADRTATENLRRAELDAARANLERQKKLLALGSGHRSDVNRAEEKLSKLSSSDE